VTCNSLCIIVLSENDNTVVQCLMCSTKWAC